MDTAGKIKQGYYFDSVTLMRVGRELSAHPGVVEASVVMGTESNKSILQMSGLLLVEFKKAGDQDLLIAVKAKTAASAADAMAKAEELLTRKKESGDGSASAAPAPRNVTAALEALEGANLALISVAGRYAAREARRALAQGLNVMLFSDNVSLADELALKQQAHKQDLLVMGPDCGTAIIQGVPLAFANAVPRGRIGVVGASGTGMQEVTCIVGNSGEGISQAIGTGGRDVKDAIGGITFLDAMHALADDPETKVLLLISKPPQPGVMRKIRAQGKKIKKPIVTLFLGAAQPPYTLEEAALQAVAMACGENPAAVHGLLADRDAVLQEQAKELVRLRPRAKGRYLRGLFSGGTFCAEAQVVLSDVLKPLYANAPLGSVKPLKNAWKPQKHSLIDLGEDVFTVGRPHPMIDFSLRNKMILDEAANPETACILLDLVLGYGAHADPLSELLPVIREAATKVFVVVGVIGTDADPQNRPAVVDALRKAGAQVEVTNAAACVLAGAIISALPRKSR